MALLSPGNALILLSSEDSRGVTSVTSLTFTANQQIIFYRLRFLTRPILGDVTLRFIYFGLRRIKTDTDFSAVTFSFNSFQQS